VKESVTLTVSLGFTYCSTNALMVGKYFTPEESSELSYVKPEAPEMPPRVVAPLMSMFAPRFNVVR
jgi:hypothetical protein